MFSAAGLKESARESHCDILRGGAVKVHGQRVRRKWEKKGMNLRPEELTSSNPVGRAQGQAQVQAQAGTWNDGNPSSLSAASECAPPPLDSSHFTLTVHLPFLHV